MSKDLSNTLRNDLYNKGTEGFEAEDFDGGFEQGECNTGVRHDLYLAQGAALSAHTFNKRSKKVRFRFGTKALICSVLALTCAATLNFPAMNAFATASSSSSSSAQTSQSQNSASSSNSSSSKKDNSATNNSSSNQNSNSSNNQANTSDGQSGTTDTTDTSTEEVPAAQLSDDMSEQERADALKAEAQSLKGKADQVASRLNQMAASLETSYEDLNQVKTNLTQTQQEITDLETKIAETKARLDAAKEALSTTVKEMYCSGGEARFISVLLDSCDFETFVSTGFMFNKIAANWKQSISQAGELSQAYEEQKSSLSQAQQKQNSLQLEATKKGASVVQAMTDQATLLQNLDAETLAKARAFDSVTGSDYASTIGSHSSALSNALSASETWYTNTGDSTSRDGSHPEAVDIARQYLGIDYVWAGASPSGGFDCSGLVLYVYAQLGINLPHFARSQYDCGIHIAYSALMPGDLVFFGSSVETIHHVGIYIGNGQFIHAPQTGDVVKISSLSSRSDLVGACRP